MRRANVIGKILNISPVREYNKNGREGKVCNVTIADESSNTKAVLWDLHHIDLVQKGKLKIGDVIELSNANVRNGELHLGSFSDIKKSKEELKNVIEERVFNTKRLNEVKAGESFVTRAVIVQVFDPRYFEVCPECGKKVVDGKCVNHGEVESKKRALLNIVLDDGSETIRSVLFGEQINKLGLNDGEVFSLDKFHERKQDILGEEKIFFGNIRSNQVFNTNEFNIDKIEDIDPVKLIKELESKV